MLQQRGIEVEVMPDLRTLKVDGHLTHCEPLLEDRGEAYGFKVETRGVSV